MGILSEEIHELNEAFGLRHEIFQNNKANKVNCVTGEKDSSGLLQFIHSVGYRTPVTSVAQTGVEGVLTSSCSCDPSPP